MQTEIQPALTGAEDARVSMIAPDAAGRAVGELLVPRSGFSAHLHSAGQEAGHAAGQEAGDSVGTDGESAVLILAHTGSARAVAEIVSELAGGRSDTGRLRVWPVFVAGSPADLTDFDAALDELPPGSADLVLVLTAAPSPEAAAEALFAWLTVKLPAPASVLGRLPDATGRTCRYVALGLTIGSGPPQLSGGLPGGTDASEQTSGFDHARVPAPAEIDHEVAVEALAFEWADRLTGDLAALPAVGQLHAARKRLADAVHVLDPRAALEAERELAGAAGRDVSHAVGGLVAGIRGEASDGSGDEAPAPGAGFDDDSGREVLRQSAGAVAEFALLAGRSGWGRMWAKRKMALAAEQVRDAADAVVALAESRFSALAAELILRAAEATVHELAVREAAEAASRSRVEAERLTEDRRRELADATRAGRVWNNVNEVAVQRVWGGGLPEPRRYLIGGEVADSVVDLTDPANPCLRVTSAHCEGRDRVLVAQYGLSLPALV